MADDRVNAKPDDLRKLARALERYEQQISQVNKDASRALAGAYWHDRQKDRFEARFRDLQKRINSFASGEIKDMIKSLNSLAADLDRVRSHRF